MYLQVPTIGQRSQQDVTSTKVNQPNNLTVTVTVDATEE